MKILFILNEPPYGNERSYNALRMAKSLTRQECVKEVVVFLMADAVACAKQGQHPPEGYYNIELMIQSLTRQGSVLLCGTCLDARGITEKELIEKTYRSSLEELSNLCVQTDKHFVF